MDERSERTSLRPLTVAMWVVGGLFVAVGFWFNVFYARTNVLTGQVTHPYALVGWIMWIVGLGFFAGAFKDGQN